MDQTETAKNKPGSITDYDVYLFKQGAHTKMYEKLGSHVTEKDGTGGVHFAVWAPNADSVSVIGDFNGWNKALHSMSPRWDESGIWESFIPGLGKGEVYKYYITSKFNNYRVEKSDPYARRTETPPKTASIVWEPDYEWREPVVARQRYKYNSLDAPISIYEVHIGSWRRVPEEGHRSLTYREMARSAGRIREVYGVHARGVPPGHGASVLRLMGVPDYRVFRPYEQIRKPGGFHVSRRRASSKQYRRYPGLGPVTFPRETSTGSSTSTALTSTSTQTRERGFTPTGAHIFSTTAGTRSGHSLKAAQCTGSTSTISTA